MRQVSDLKLLNKITDLQKATDKYILRALKTKHWHRHKTAHALGIARRTLNAAINRLKIDGWDIPTSKDGRASNGRR